MTLPRIPALVLLLVALPAFLTAQSSPGDTGRLPAPGSNPIFRDAFTADPAPLVVGDTLYVYVGHDEAGQGQMFNITEWLCYSTTDMRHWTAHGSVMKPTDFAWATGEAWASQAIGHGGKYFFYTTVQHGPPHVGKAIGVAVSDSPLGPFHDARGSALVTDDTTPSPYGWNDIDPTVFTDDDGTTWLAWGNPILYVARLKPSMTEIDGPIAKVALPNYTEGPWISKHGALYYLTYAAFAHQGFSERICYATAPSMDGPWTYRGVLAGEARNSYTIHPGIAEFKGQSYLFYHNAALTLPDGRSGALGRRSVCADYLFYNDDGTLQPVTQTVEGTSVPAHPLPKESAAPVNYGTTSPGITLVESTDDYPSSWPGKPAVASVANPFEQTPTPVAFRNDGGVTSMGQTFVVPGDITLGRLTLYAGDGFGTDPEHLLNLALYDLGPAGTEAPAAEYNVSQNLLGDGAGVRIAYKPQGAGLLHIDFAAGTRVALVAGHRYALEIQAARNSAALYWRMSRKDIYPGGAAYFGRKLAHERDGSSTDFAFALYPAAD